MSLPLFSVIVCKIPYKACILSWILDNLWQKGFFVSLLVLNKTASHHSALLKGRKKVENIMFLIHHQGYYFNLFLCLVDASVKTKICCPVNNNNRRITSFYRDDSLTNLKTKEIKSESNVASSTSQTLLRYVMGYALHRNTPVDILTINCTA